jgi:hypothetical protein
MAISFFVVAQGLWWGLSFVFGAERRAKIRLLEEIYSMF